MGAPLRMMTEQLKMHPMTERALHPVIVLISDGSPTDDFESGLNYLLKQPWGVKSVRIAIAIGNEVDMGILQRFIGSLERKPLQANNPKTLTSYIRWISTVVLKSASSPSSQISGELFTGNVVIPPPQNYEDQIYANDVW